MFGNEFALIAGLFITVLLGFIYIADFLARHAVARAFERSTRVEIAVTPVETS
jgi:hypothetical protein